MKRQARWAAVLGLVIVAGCATPATQSVSTGRAILEARQIIEIATVPYALLPLDAEVKTSLDYTNPVIELDGHRTFARGFMLPKVEATLTLSVHSYRFGSASDAAIVYPDVRLLDDQFRVIEIVRADRFVYRTTTRGDGLSVDVFVDMRSSPARYVLLAERATVDAQILDVQTNTTGQQAVAVPVKGGGALLMWFLPTGLSTPPVKLVAAPAGEIELRAALYAPQRVTPAK